MDDYEMALLFYRREGYELGVYDEAKRAVWFLERLCKKLELSEQETERIIKEYENSY